jgi:hypothetical protein
MALSDTFVQAVSWKSGKSSKIYTWGTYSSDVNECNWKTCPQRYVQHIDISNVGPQTRQTAFITEI